MRRSLIARAVAVGLLSVSLARAQEAPADPPAVSVTATATKNQVDLGEPFVVELRAEGPEGTQYVFPAELQGESVELRSLARDSPPAGQTPEPWPPGVHRYEARAYALGEVEVPPLTVTYRTAGGAAGEASSGPVKLDVQSVLPKDPEERKLADIREPISVGVGRAFWVALGLGLLAIAGLALLLWRRRGRPAPAASPIAMPVLAPGPEALQALDRLARSSFLVQGDARGYYIALTTIAKRYLERQLGAPILEMTTAEMMARLRDHPRGKTLVPVMRDLAPAADQVKFARGSALREEAERHGNAVRAMVEGLEAQLEAEARAQAATVRSQGKVA